MSGAEAFAGTFHGGGMYPTFVFWLPNPAFWVGLCFLALRIRPVAGAMGALAVGMALPPHFLGLGDSVRAGHYVWLLSLVLLVVASFCVRGYDALDYYFGEARP